MYFKLLPILKANNQRYILIYLNFVWLLVYNEIQNEDYETSLLHPLHNFCGPVMTPFLYNESVLHLINTLPYLKQFEKWELQRIFRGDSATYVPRNNHKRIN